MTTSMRWGRGRGPSPESARRRRNVLVGAELAALMEAPGPGAWVESGACRGLGDPDVMFPAAAPGSRAHAAQTAAARRVCTGCPVRAECLSHALDAGEDAGVWGGLDEDERRALRRASGEEAA